MLKKVDFYSSCRYSRGMTTGQVIAKRRIELGWTQEDLAKKMGYTSKTTITKIESDKIDLPRRKVKMIADVLGISVNELFPDVPSYNPETTTLTIPFVTQKVSAGFGEEELPDECLEVRSIDILASMAKGIGRKALTAAEVKGDSMIEANIYNGDIVIFARGRIEGDGIYVLALAGEVLVKRLQFDALSNELTIISMNKNYAPKTVSADADGLRILGKVVGWFHNEI